MHEFNSTLPIAVYIAVGSVEEGIPDTAKRSAGKVAVTS